MSRPVAVHHPHDPTRPTVIPAERFDPDEHTRWREPGEAMAVSLPADMPARARAALIDAGIDTMQKLSELGDYTEVPGIGQSTADDLAAWLEAR